MKKEEKSSSGKFTLMSNELGIYVLKLDSEGSTESIWLDEAELEELKNFLNTRER